VQEMKNLVKNHPGQCSDLPKTFAKNLIKKHDENNDGKLNFEEFFKLSQEQNWIRDICIKYCELIVPRREPVDNHG
jgi:Ca2+-binding EF-hand superfamily protein